MGCVLLLHGALGDHFGERRKSLGRHFGVFCMELAHRSRIEHRDIAGRPDGLREAVPQHRDGKSRLIAFLEKAREVIALEEITRRGLRGSMVQEAHLLRQHRFDILEPHLAGIARPCRIDAFRHNPHRAGACGP